MTCSGHDAAENERFVEEAELELVESRLETIVEPDYGEGTWRWLLARRPRRPGPGV